MRKTKKQEAYAVALFAGMPQRDAYLLAYPGSEKWAESTLRPQAARAAAMPVVQERLAELRNAAAKVIVDTVGEIMAYEITHATAELDEAIRMAKENGAAAPMVNAIRLKAEIHGLLIQRHESGRVGEFGILPRGKAASDDMLARIRSERASRQGDKRLVVVK